MQDITNHYVLEAVSGGMVTLALFVLMIALSFGAVGRLWRAASGDRAALYLGWCLGVSLFVHCCNFMAVSYFGQISMMWYLTLAIIISLAPVRVPMEAGRVIQPSQRWRAVRSANGEGFRPLMRPARSGASVRT
jgi:hypothetical protein